MIKKGSIMSLHEKIEHLRCEIDSHEYNFFVLGESSICSYELDELKTELALLEAKEQAAGSEPHLEVAWKHCVLKQPANAIRNLLSRLLV